MGIPIYLYEDAEVEQLRRFPWCADECRRRLRDLWAAKAAGTRGEDDYGARPGDGMVCAWRFDLQRQIESPLVNLAELESVRSKDASKWVFYKADGSEMVVYGGEWDQLTPVPGVQELIQGSEITSVDIQSTTLVLGLQCGSIEVVTCDTDGRVREGQSVDLRSGRILDVFAGLLPDYVVCFSAEEGLLCTKMATGRTSKLQDVPEARPQHVSIDFPQISAFNAAELWYCDDLLASTLAPVVPPLRPGEHLLHADPSAENSLLLETNLRYISLDTANPASTGCTVLHKTECGAPARSHTSTGAHQLFVSEQHLYATSLTMYGRCARDREYKWLSLGYSDIRAKYNICKVLRLTLLACHGASYLALLADDGSVHCFTIEC